MADVMMMLGDYSFGVDTAAFTELNRTSAWRWLSQEVFESRPVLQYTGQGKETITLPGTIYPEYWGGTGQLDDIRALADDGKIQSLVDGIGNVVGDFVITEISERQSIFAQAGVARRQEFTITLERAPDSGEADTPAVPDMSSVVAVEVPAAPAGAGTVSALQSSVTSSQSDADSIAAKVNGLRSTLSPVLTAVRAAASLQSAAKTAAASVQGLTGTAGLVAATSAVKPLLSETLTTMQVANISSDNLSAMGADATTIGVVNQLAVAAVNINAKVNGILGGFK